MARYSLIMKDSAYMTLMMEAAKRGISMGKLLNEIINDKVVELGRAPKQMKAKCEACGIPAVFQVIYEGEDKAHFYCGIHAHARGGKRMKAKKKLEF